MKKVIITVAGLIALAGLVLFGVENAGGFSAEFRYAYQSIGFTAMAIINGTAMLISTTGLNILGMLLVRPLVRKFG